MQFSNIVVVSFTGARGGNRSTEQWIETDHNMT